MNTRFSTWLYLGCVGLALVAGCGSTPTDPTPPRPDPDPLPQGTACSSFAIACYDEFAHQPANLACFRPVSRWNKTSLTWRLANRTGEVPSADQVNAARRVLDAWAAVSSLTFERALGDSADITITFEPNEHGDEFPFVDSDATSNVLGHAFFPGSPRPGAVHLRDSEVWSLDPQPGQFDLYTVLLHEIGHALGLEHSLADGAVMGPTYVADGTAQLTDTDIEAIQSLYGSPGGDVPPEPVRLPANFCDPGNLTALGDPDTDGDGIPDTIEVFVLGTDPFVADTDGDGVDDFTEVFIDGTSPTTDASLADADADGLPDDAEALAGSDPANPDSDGDTLTDGFEVLFYGTSPTNVDTDGDGLLDPDDPYPTNALYGPTGPDCDGNGIRDALDIAFGRASDCNGNGVPDACDIASNASTDVNGNAIPDDCDDNPCDDGDACTADELTDGACVNTPIECDDGLFCNGVETCDDGECIPGEPPCSTSQSCNEATDICTTPPAPPPPPPPPDCDGDGIPDAQELAQGNSTDCNKNAIPDDCDLTAGTSTDLNENGVPDECDPILVDDNVEGANDGTSWNDAFSRLTDAIDAAVARTTVYPSLPVVEIWVAEGTYTPASFGTGDRDASFALRDRVAIYGGFSGVSGGFEKLRSQRDLANHVTILSGDNLFNDEQQPLAAAAGSIVGLPDNAYHVVTATDTDASALLDGFYVVRGQADDASGTPRTSGGGGGMLLTNSNTTIANCTFAYNYVVDSGSGAFAFGGSPTFVNVVFVNNTAVGGQQNAGLGGGLATIDAAVRVINCTFTLNFALLRGGGIALDVSGDVNGTAVILNSILWNNSSEGGQAPVERELVVITSAGSTGPIVGTNVIGGLVGTANFNIGRDPLFVNSQACFGTPSPLEAVLLECMLGLALDRGSPCIDSSLNSLQLDPDPPVVAPETDRFDALRTDDPSVDPPPGLGSNVVKDRGAFERDPAPEN